MEQEKSELEKEYCKKIGCAIRKLRKQYSAKSLCIFAYENDIARSTLSRIERGEGECGIVSLKRIATGFGWSLEELCRHIEEELGEDFTLIDL